jgi:hypothetical protein
MINARWQKEISKLSDDELLEVLTDPDCVKEYLECAMLEAIIRWYKG